MKKYTSLKKFNYISPWNEEECSEKSQVGFHYVIMKRLSYVIWGYFVCVLLN